MSFAELATDQGDLLCATAVAGTVAVWAWLYLSRLAAWAFVLAYLTTIVTTTGLKLVALEVLPPLAGAAPMTLSQGAPSGHMALATVVYGTAALFCGKAGRDWRAVLGQILCVAVIACVGFTRVELRNHTIADVLAGLAMGGLALSFPAMVVRARPVEGKMLLGRLIATMALVNAMFLLSGIRMPSSRFI